jgi:hypothetical protein
MEAGALPEQVEAVVRHIERLGFRAHPIPGAFRPPSALPGTAAKPIPPCW